MEIIKVVLTGGPCAGKTTALNSIREYLIKSNIPFVTVPETATELIINGIKPFNENLVYMFQSIVLQKQLSKELLAEKYIKYFYNNEKCVIIYDRGVLDNKAYLNSKEDFKKLLIENGKTEIDILDEYDLVLDLLSTATCKKEVYNLQNEARTEDVELATNIDYKTSLAWIHHRNLKIINSSISIEDEIKIILNHISEILNNNQKKEIKRYLINDFLSNYNIYNDDNSEELFITDYFIENKDNNVYNYLISKREYNNETSYIYSIYKEENGITSYIYDKMISKEEYYSLISRYKILNKVERKEINFIQNKQKYKLCFYDGYTTLEIEENKLNNELIIPDNLNVIREIIDDYSKTCRNSKVKVLSNGNI